MDDYTKQLENVIKQMLEPIKNIPFKLVVNSLTGKNIISVNVLNKLDLELINDLTRVADYIGLQLNREGIYSSRVNEVGNKIERYVLDGLNYFGFKAVKPKNSAGRIVNSGYPDIYFLDKNGGHNYLECKTYNKQDILTSLRSFYFSPSKNPKIIYDARHLLLSYQVEEIKRLGNQNLYKFTAWKILSLENLLVDLKYEFNTDNIHLYDSKLVLAEKKINTY